MEIETMRYYYINGLWSVERLDKLVKAGRLTEEEREAIVKGEEA